ncbi:hypothetical protein ABZ502_34175 [Streptomyces abikoensis]|uniref:hypothetical protein n=1 Tax=Streptomyces abikoensis TaxID=97398 RepID=UPI0034115EAA
MTEPNLVDARPAVRHVRALTGQQPAPSIAAIARTAGLPASTLKTILLDVEAGKDRTMRADAAQRLLAIGATTAVPTAYDPRHETAASEVVQHVRHLQATYELASIAFIAKAAGVPGSTLKAILDQHAADPRRTVSTPSARKILAVTTLPAPAYPRQEHVTDIGLLRRLRGLCALGWTLRAIAEVGGIADKTLNQFLLTGVSTPSTRAAVLTAWKELEHQPGPSQTARQRALKKRWPTSFAWDEAGIDLPDSLPCGARMAGRSEEWTAQQLQEELDFLRGTGLNWTESLRRLGLGTQRARELLAERKATDPPCPFPHLPSGRPASHTLAA